MAAGDMISNIVSVASNGYLDMQPAEGVEWVIHNFGYAGAAELYFYDGVNQVKVDTDTGAGSRLGVNLHCTNTKYYRLKNISGVAALLSYDGVQTSGMSFIGDCAYVYIAYASDNLGTNFSNSFSSSLNYIAVKTTNEPIDNPVASDFTGLWKKYSNTDSPSLLGTYTHSGNKEVCVSAVDVDTNTFTSVGHGLQHNTMVYAIPNRDIGRLYFASVLPGGMVPNSSNFSNTIYYIIFVDEDHFQVSATSNGSAIDLTVNAAQDLTKWHFELCGSISNVLFSNFPAGKRRIRVLVNGQFLRNDGFIYAKPNSINSDASCYNAGTFTDYPWMGQTATIFNASECIVDSNYLLNFFVDRHRILPNGASTTSNTINNNCNFIYTDPRYGKFDITSLKVDGLSTMANGTVVSVYDVSGGAAINGIPTGGTEGQQLVKKSAADYDAEWKDISAPIASLVWSGNTVIEITSVDIENSIITSVSHGLVDNMRGFFFLKKDAGNVYLPKVMIGGTAHNQQYFVRVLSADTFKIVIISSGEETPVVFSNNADMDLTKINFEATSDAGSHVMTITGLPPRRKYRLKIEGRCGISSPYGYPMPAGWAMNLQQWYAGTAYGGYSLHMGNIMFKHNILFNGDKQLSADVEGLSIASSTTTALTRQLINDHPVSILRHDEDISEIGMVHNSGFICNETIMEVYEV